MQAKLRLSQPGDPAELEADQVAEAVVSGRQFQETGGWPPNSAPAGSSVQRKCAACEKEDEEQEVHRKADDTVAREAAPEEKSAAARIVDDDVRELSAGQMRKSDFLSALRQALCQTVDEALKGTSRSTDGCPWIERLFAAYASQSSSDVEAAVRRYVPKAASVQSAAGYISLILARVGRAAAVWAKTGQVTGLPEGFSAGSATGPTAAKPAAAAPEQVSFKTRDGAQAPATDATAVRSQLGGGSPMESGVRSRMESAFGMDFSAVRVHTDAAGANLSDRLSARAFTVGSDIAVSARHSLGRRADGSRTGARSAARPRTARRRA
ncbi:MAG: DUF4157 domain-containing protein [Bryobacteraceae bacterium]